MRTVPTFQIISSRGPLSFGNFHISSPGTLIAKCTKLHPRTLHIIQDVTHHCHVYQVTPQDSHHGLDCRTQSAMPAAAKALSCRILTHESEDEGRQEAGRRGGGAEGRREVNLQQMRIFQWLCRSSVGKHSVEHAPSRRGGGEKRVSYSAF